MRGFIIRHGLFVLACGTGLAIAAPVHAGYIFTFTDASGLSAEAEFTLLNGTTLQVRLKNTSTGLPGGFSNSDQLLTGLSWDFGPIGPGGNSILGGSIFTGPNSQSLNFDVTSVGANADIGGEWGFGNNNGTGALQNFISGNSAQSTPFGGANLDGPVSQDGPQAGLVSSAFMIDLGGLGAIKDEVVATLNLAQTITDASLLSQLLAGGTRVEFGSDAAFLPGTLVPAPGALGLLMVAALRRTRRRR